MQREGYLLVDHSASPGLPEWAARQSGFDPGLTKEGRKFEAPTLTCSHCKSAVVKSAARRERASCAKCGGKYICDYCDWRSRQFGYDHMPYEKFSDVTRELAVRGMEVKSYEHLIYQMPLPLKPQSIPVSPPSPAPLPATAPEATMKEGPAP